MTAQPDLFLPDPSWLSHPVSEIEKHFVLFHRTNPAIYRELEERALRLRHKGVRRIGIKMLWENIRYSLLETRGDAFKLNNNYTALYARLLLFRRPELADCIEVRERIAGAAIR